MSNRLNPTFRSIADVIAPIVARAEAAQRAHCTAKERAPAVSPVVLASGVADAYWCRTPSEWARTVLQRPDVLLPGESEYLIGVMRRMRALSSADQEKLRRIVLRVQRAIGVERACEHV